MQNVSSDEHKTISKEVCLYPSLTFMNFQVNKLFVNKHEMYLFT